MKERGHNGKRERDRDRVEREREKEGGKDCGHSKVGDLVYIIVVL